MNTLIQPEAANDFILAVVGSPWGWLAIWLVLINITAFVTFGIDKLKSKRQGARRIPERNLFLTAFFGGSLGAWLGMKVWHHKTLHKSFRIGIPAIFFTELLLFLGLLLYFTIFR